MSCSCRGWSARCRPPRRRHPGRLCQPRPHHRTRPDHDPRRLRRGGAERRVAVPAVGAFTGHPPRLGPLRWGERRVGSVVGDPRRRARCRRRTSSPIRRTPTPAAPPCWPWCSSASSSSTTSRACCTCTGRIDPDRPTGTPPNGCALSEYHGLTRASTELAAPLRAAAPGSLAPRAGATLQMRAHRIVKSQQPAELCEVRSRTRPGRGAGQGRRGRPVPLRPPPHALPEPPELPFTIGHETAGWVEAVGAGVRASTSGSRCIVHGAWGCGRCRRCQADLEQYCENVASMSTGGGSGLGRDGGMAEYLLVPAVRHLVPLGDLDPRVWAPLDDAALTPYHALKRLMPLCTPDNWAMVIGIGGLGHAAVQLLKELTGARWSPSTSPTTSWRWPPTSVPTPSSEAMPPTPPSRSVTSTGARVWPPSSIVSGSTPRWRWRPRVHSVSHIVVVGVGLGTLPINVLSVPWETSVSTTFWGTSPSCASSSRSPSAGRFQLHVEQIPLELAGEAYGGSRPARSRAGWSPCPTAERDDRHGSRPGRAPAATRERPRRGCRGRPRRRPSRWVRRW